MLNFRSLQGVLRIHVVEAKDLMKKDIGVLGKGKSDPYAIVTVGAQQFKTQTIDNTVNPKWDYWCEVITFCGNNIIDTFHCYTKCVRVSFFRVIILDCRFVRQWQQFYIILSKLTNGII